MGDNQADKDLHVAVMEAMWPLPAVNPSYCTEQELQHQRARADKWRQWIEAQTDLDRDTLRHYKEWLAYCDYQNDKGATELVLQTRRKSMEEYDQRQREQRERVSRITIPKPVVKF